MGSRDDLDIDEFFGDLAAIGVGATILGLRRLNIARRDFTTRVPAAAPLVDAALDGIEAITPAVSATIGAAVTTAGDVVPGQRGEQMQRLGKTITAAAPELLRLSGLTAR